MLLHNLFPLQYPVCSTDTVEVVLFCVAVFFCFFLRQSSGLFLASVFLCISNHLEDYLDCIQVNTFGNCSIDDRVALLFHFDFSWDLKFDCFVFQSVEPCPDITHSNFSLHADDGSPFDALQTLADISLMMPEAADTGKPFVF